MELTHDNVTEFLESRTLSVKYGEISYYANTYETQYPTVLFIHGSGGNKTWFPKYFIDNSLSKYGWLVPALFGYEKNADEKMPRTPHHSTYRPSPSLKSGSALA